MIELLTHTPKELIEVERIIKELLDDNKHPLNNRSHPYHHDSLQAISDLMAYAENLRNCHLN